MAETLLSPSNILLFGREVEDLGIIHPAPTGGARHTPFTVDRTGLNRDVEGQLTSPGARFARIYGFSYEGSYYDLPRPTVFLVHGAGELVTRGRAGGGNPHGSRAPGEPSLTGVVAADFQFVDELRAWSYDRADYSIRMDIETGMFEDILLDAFFNGGGSGGPVVGGARVSGARVSGARVSGARVSGARLSGGRGDASD